MARKIVLITGGAGYIGAVLTELLLDQGWDVRVLDRFFFGHTLDHLRDREGFCQIKGDIRWHDAAVLQDVDAVCDLAALSNDPVGDLAPAKTLEINYRGRERMATRAKEQGVSRYVLASSCSVYGFQEGLVDEQTIAQPLTTYAEANLAAEEAVLALSDAAFCTTVLRQATVYGLAPRMRFDLAINGMVLALHETGRIRVLRDGTQWRPMVHVRDTCAAFLQTLEAPCEHVNGQVFNVGSDEQNFQILPLAQRLCAALGQAVRWEWYGSTDNRSYRVSFSKIRTMLRYQPRHTPEDAAQEIWHALVSCQVDTGSRTRTVEWYRQLLQWNDLLRDVVLDGKLL